MSKVDAPPLTVDPAAAVEAGATAAAASGRGSARRRRSVFVSLASYAATVFVLITLNFAVPRLMPGSPLEAMEVNSSPNYVSNDATRAALAEYYNLDASIPEQYVHYLGNLVQGDFGTSILTNTPVGQELGSRVAWSFLLLGTAMAISLLIGLPAGIHSGWHRGKRVDRGLLGLFLSIQNLPVYVVGAVAFVLFTAKLGIFPPGQAETPFGVYSGFSRVIDIAQHLALPALLLATDFATYQYLVMRSSMVSELGSDYLLGGRAKGLRKRTLKYRYAGRNALLPVVTVIGLQMGVGVTSIIFIERIFNYPGVGGYMFGGVGTRDYPVMQASFLVLTTTVLTTNLLVDLIYRRIDPRTAT